MTLSRRERLRIATTEEIKAIARRQMADEGVSNISLRGIARQMGISAPALYRYFASYDDLITALVADAYTSLGEAMARARDEVAADAYGARLQAIAYAYREWAMMYQSDYLLIYGTPIPGYVAPEEVIGPPEKRIWSVFFEVLAAAHDAGVLKLADNKLGTCVGYQRMQAQAQEMVDVALTVPLLHQAVTLWTQLHGLIMAELTGRFHTLGSEPFYVEVNYMIERLGLDATSLYLDKN